MKNEQPYNYIALKSTSRDIRILSLLPGEWGSDIHCTIKAISLDDNPKYEALSYTWGDTAITKSIFIDKVKVVQVTTNLELALQHLRKQDESLMLWVDALCINQIDQTEKSHQVALMGDIYRKCSQVYIWLGCDLEGPTMRAVAQNKDDDPFAFIHHFADDKHLNEMPYFYQVVGTDEYSFRENPPFWAGLYAVIQSPWWSRVWTVQIGRAHV